MSQIYYKQQLNQLMSDLSTELDVPSSKYVDAKEHYEAVGDWLGDKESILSPYEPVIYPQGSFALGTAVRPLGDDEYDVDCVCLLQIRQDITTQRKLKTMVGDRLKHPQSRYKNMLDPQVGGRRCWTIKYADASKFHLDVLPAIPDDCLWLTGLGVPETWAKHAICITDRDTWNEDRTWPRSNPKGYVEWFKKQMAVRLEEGRKAIAMAKKADVQRIEDFEVRTPLQRLIQLLKRHRDLRYNGDDDKPISVIITTLAARAYNNEADLFDALLSVVPHMRDFIENRSGTLWISNPVNPVENFADKWVKCSRKRELFFEWLGAIEREHKELLTDRGFEKVGMYLAESYGKRDATAAFEKYAKRLRESKQPVPGVPLIIVPPKTKDDDKPVYSPIKISQPSKPYGTS